MTLTDVLNKAIAGLGGGSPTAKPKGDGGRVAAFVERIASLLETLVSKFTELAGKLSSAVSPAMATPSGATPPPLPGLPGSVMPWKPATPATTAAPAPRGGGAGGFAAAAGVGAVAFKALTGAVSSTIGAISQLGSQVQAFVQAFNPAVVYQFTRAMENLFAAFGKILEPIMTVATQLADYFNQIVTELSSVMLPYFKQLGAIILEVGKALMDGIKPLLVAFYTFATTVLTAVMPVVRAMTPLFEKIGDLATRLFQAMTPLIEAALPPLVTILEKLVDVTTAVVEAFSEAAGRVGNAGRSVARDAWSFIPPVAAIRALQGLFSGPADAVQRNRPRAMTIAARAPAYLDTEAIGRQARLGALQVVSAEQRAQIQRQEMIEHLRRIGQALPNRNRERAWFELPGVNDMPR